MPATRTAVLVAVGLLGLLTTHYPTLLSGFVRMQPEAGDAILNNYFLEHTYRWAFDRAYPYSFWSPGFFYPAPYTFTYSETLIGTAPLYWLLRAVGLPESVACQVWTLILFALNYASMAVVLRWFGVNTVLTATGAYLFAFGLVRVSHLTHQQLIPQFMSPFAVWYAWSMVQDPTPRRWALLVGLTSWQILASLHLGWFLGFGLAIFAGWALCVEAGCGRRVWTFVRTRPVAFGVPVVLAGVVVGGYARTFYKAAPERREYWQAASYAPYIDGWFVAYDGSLWRDVLTPRPVENFSEKQLFQGFGALAVMAVGGWYAYRRRFAGRGLALCGAGTALTLTVLVTKWGYDVSLWFVVHSLVPGANAFRAVGRVAFVVYLFGIIGGTVGFQAWVADRFPARGRWLLLGLFALVVVEQLVPRPDSFRKADQGYGQAEALVPAMRGADVAYVVYDGSIPDYRHHIAAMFGGMWADVPTINGFSGAQPKDFPAYTYVPSLDELITVLGPDWRGTLAVIEWGPPVRRTVYRVEPGGRWTVIPE
ncbi:MAG TPA: hypothetical protein VM597_13065 [Gemmataceae bacterium]|nr:hypothetical protein [Gemmataceae bacterium]